MPNPGLLAAAVLALAAVGCAALDEPAASADARQCFRAGDVNGFSPVDDRSVIVNARARDKYLLELAGICPQVDWSQRIALRSRGSSWICRGYDAELVVPTPSGSQLCTVRAVRRLTEAEAEALRRR